MAFVGLLAVIAPGCRKTPKTKAPTTPKMLPAPPPLVSRFQVRDITKPVERPCNLTALVPRIGLDALRRSRYFRYDTAAGDNLAAFRGGANVLYILSNGARITPDATKGTLTVGVDLTLQREKPNEPGKETFDVVVRLELSYDRARDGFVKDFSRKSVERALREAIERAELLARSRNLPTSRLIARVSDTNPYRRDAAIQNLGFRRSKEAVPALINALKSSDKNTVLRAVGALSSIADRRAIEPLSKLLGTTNRELLRAVVFAIGDIGGSAAAKILRAKLATCKDETLKKWLELAIRSASESDSD